MRSPLHFAWLGLLLLGWTLLQASEEPSPADGAVYVLDIEGVIGPATSDYITRSMDTAAENDARLIVLRMDTPGGLDSSMRSIIRLITSSQIPIATFVAPSGARAASAGTYILYASHIAAMSPGTNLGAATPVSIGGPGGAPQPDPDRGQEDAPAEDGKAGDEPADASKDDGDRKPEASRPPQPGTAMERKAVNDAVAYIRSLAELRGRNADWAERAVREAASLPAGEALKLNVIDLVVGNRAELLSAIDGMTVQLPGREVTLATADAPVEELAPDWRTRLLAVITNPNVAYILMLVGIYGLIFEFSNPGAIVPGTIGAISLLLALFAFQVLPVNYAGMALILLGLALMVGEAFAPSFGMLGIGGVIAFVIGSVILMDTNAPGYDIAVSLIITFALVSALVFVFVIGAAIKTRRQAATTGQEEMLGEHGVALEDFTDQGQIRTHSEIWQARSSTPIAKGQRVRVTGMHGLVLTIEPEEAKQEENRE